MDIAPGHLVCIVGGAIAGSEAANRLTSRGIRTIVIEQGAVPWGKIELGLPKWHAKQRDQEEAGIDDKLDHSLVHYLPCTKLGADLLIRDITNWGVSAVLLAVGAWRDRPLSLPDIHDYLDKGFVYQNPFVSWFNQYHDPSYQGARQEIPDDAIVVGGGLASLDVVKILMLETTVSALAERGIQADLFTLEKKGIPKTLEALNITWESLGLKGCTLFYRRGPQHMPLIPLDDDPSPERLAQAEKVRIKLLQTAQEKYLFRFQPFSIPVDTVSEAGHLKGLVFRKTEVQAGRVTELAGTDFTVHSPLVVASVGSLPEPIPHLPIDRELFHLEDMTTCRVKGFENVFALGNAVTGRGNIRASRLHAREVADWVMDQFLEWTDEDLATLNLLAPLRDRDLEEFCRQKHLLSGDRIRSILAQVAVLQEKVGYDGNYSRWIEANRPVRMEHL
jgi:NADPH-dependent glutamate synthase beta subunit-like oxidoreductase